MHIPIFWRLSLGYLVILFLSVVVSSYSIAQLAALSDTARTALNTDNRMIAYEEKLTDAFLSEVRYAGRFIITHSNPLYEQFRQFNKDFVHYLTQIKSLAESAEIRTRLARIEELHQRYHDLFNQEVRYIQARQPYAESRYQQEREKALESELREMERLKAFLQQNLHDKLETIEKAARNAGAIATVTTLILLGLGVAISFVMSKSLTTPLVELRRQAAAPIEETSYSASVFASIPEIRELAETLNKTRKKVDASAKTNAAFVRTIGEQFTMPLVSLKKRLATLNQELTDTVTLEQRATFEVVTEETDHLIKRCALLSSTLTEPAEAQDSGPASTSTLGQDPVSGRGHLHAREHGNKLLNGWEGAVRPFGDGWRNRVSQSWNVIFHSIKMPGYKKARKQ